MGTIYFVNGFLDAGKTTFIKELIARESFRIPGKTMKGKRFTLLHRHLK